MISSIYVLIMMLIFGVAAFAIGWSIADTLIERRTT